MSRGLREERNFNPRSPHGERQNVSAFDVRQTRDFNPRSPHGERRTSPGGAMESRYFNPRSPHGERPRTDAHAPPCESISIHAPRTGSDQQGGKQHDKTRKFQSTLPARGATGPHSTNKNAISFQSTLPARGATGFVTDDDGTTTFQSTLPARGATLTPARGRLHKKHFNPRSPHGERRGIA